MEKLSTPKAEAVKKLGTTALIRKLSGAGYSEEALDGMDRPQMLNAWAECISAGKDKPQTGATGQLTEYERQKLQMATAQEKARREEATAQEKARKEEAAALEKVRREEAAAQEIARRDETAAQEKALETQREMAEAQIASAEKMKLAELGAQEQWAREKRKLGRQMSCE